MEVGASTVGIAHAVAVATEAASMELGIQQQQEVRAAAMEAGATTMLVGVAALAAGVTMEVGHAVSMQ